MGRWLDLLEVCEMEPAIKWAGRYFGVVTLVAGIAFGSAILGPVSAQSAKPSTAGASPNVNTDLLGAVTGYLYSWVTWAGGFVSWIDTTVDKAVLDFRNSLISDATKLDDLIARTGFKLEEVSIGVGPIPSVALSIDYDRDLSIAERRQLLSELDQLGRFGLVERTLLRTLLNIAGSGYAEPNGSFGLSRVEIDVDLIPGVTVVLGRGEEKPDDSKVQGTMKKTSAPTPAPVIPVQSAPVKSNQAKTG
jgi:hypothetical protein